MQEEREVLVPAAERALLEAMIHDYIVDMTVFVPGIDPSKPYPWIDSYWSEPEQRWPFWLKAGEVNAGFALVYYDANAGRMEMSEFFVARSHRRRGMGLAAARRLIARFPGPWVITQRETNQPAIAFWHRVLEGFAVYDETTTSTDAVRREQRFTFP